MLHRAFQLGGNQDHPLVAPVPYFPRLTEDEPRRGFLKPQTYYKLLAELPSELQLFFVIAYHVDLRRGALLRNRWSQVDLKAKTIWMEGRCQNRKPEPIAVPIYGDMAKFIPTQPRSSDFLFAREAKPILDFRESWDLACQRAYQSFYFTTCAGPRCETYAAPEYQSQ